MDVATSRGRLNAAARDLIARRHQLLIDGKRVDAKSGKTALRSSWRASRRPSPRFFTPAISEGKS
jgi:hypothetical protein